MTTPMSDRPSMWQRSTTRRFLKWLFSWRTARRAVISIAVIVTLVGLFYAEENFRGKHAWDKYRRELEARGGQLDFRTFIPKPIPDEQNFATTPVIQSWFPRQDNERWKDNYSRAEAQVKADKTNRRFMDLVAWGMAFNGTYERTERLSRFRRGRGRADEYDEYEMYQNQGFESDKLDLESRTKAAPSILEALKTNEVVFAELRAASQRLSSRYPISYSLENPAEILLPHLSSVRAVCRRLQLKACAELAVGQSEDALEDVKLILALSDSVKDEPCLISYLVRVACLQLATQPIWEGLAEHAWSDTQLQKLQARLQPYNFVTDLKWPLDAERAMGIAIIDFVRKRGLGNLIEFVVPVQPTVFDEGVANFFGRILPSGWFYQEQLNYCRLFELESEGTFDGTRRQVSPSRVRSNQEALNANFSGSGAGTGFKKILRHRVLAGMLLPGLGGVARRAATGQTAADEAALACALERYRLANGQFPEKLDALAPRFISQLSHDVITGEPYKYRRTDDGPSPSGYGHAGGQFILYSVAWNEKDDGGVPGKTLFDEEQGDWVWQYPPRQ